MERKKINKLKLFSIFITTTFIFVIGIFFGKSISDSQLNNIEKLQQELRTQTLGLELQYALASQAPCNITNVNLIGNELYGMSNILASMENSLGKLNKDVLSLKEYYSLLEIKHWLFLEKIKSECKSDVPIILYFYSNLGDCDDCEKQGYVLTYLKKKNSELNIFSFDINLDNPVIDSLKNIYNLKTMELPVMIINGKVYGEFTELDSLEIILKEKN